MDLLYSEHKVDDIDNLIKNISKYNHTAYPLKN